MKKYTYLLTFLLACWSFNSFAQDPCDGQEDEIVCVEFAPGLVVPMPFCEAITTNLPIVECEEIEEEEEEDNQEECDCDWSSEEFVCVSLNGEIIEMHECDVQCTDWTMLGGLVFDVEVVECDELVYGCTDPNALNYDAQANTNDGSCEYENNNGCDCDYSTDEIICVDFGGGQIGEIHPCDLECFDWFYPVEVVDCNNLVYGCTDSSALNYNPMATVNDGSCEYEEEECDCDWNSEEFVCLSLWDGDIVEIHVCELECGFWQFEPGFEFEFEVVDCDEVSYGCTDPNALNYDQLATVNDGSCEYEEVECDCDWESEEFVCVSLWGGDVFEIHACELECGFWLFEDNFEFEIVDCDEVSYGCTDPNALNYDQSATVNDGSCEYEEEECDCDWESEEFVCVSMWGGDVFEIHACELECGFWLFEDNFEFEIVDCDEVSYGCTDPNALNYDQSATVNDGSCEYEEEECDCEWESEEFVCVSMLGGDVFEIHACELECGFWLFEDNFEFEIVDCDEVSYGCTDPNALNYDQSATVNDGSCEYEEEEECDCSWDTAEIICIQIAGGGIFEIHPCELECFGGEWFEEYEIVECGSEIYGCTDPDALNYDQSATVNDGSCDYGTNPNECDCDWTTEEYVCVSVEGQEIFTVHACDIECGMLELEFLGLEIEITDCDDNGEGEDGNDFESAWEMFNSIDIAQMGNLFEIFLYPNPAEGGVVNVNVNGEVDDTYNIQVFNSIGQTVSTQVENLVAGRQIVTVDVSNYESGIYHTVVTNSKGESLSERIVKK